LCCGKACHGPLKGCPHLCKKTCHESACDATSCREEVTVRCGCKRIKRRVSCLEAKSLLQAAGRPTEYDDSTSMRLLPCVAECAKAEVEAAAKSKDLGAGKKNIPAPVTLLKVASTEPKRKGAAREERERERERLRLAKAAAERRQDAMRGALLFCVLLAAALAALAVHRGLKAVDRAAQEVWGLQQEL
jgi:hypothetical protein